MIPRTIKQLLCKKSETLSTIQECNIDIYTIEYLEKSQKIVIGPKLSTKKQINQLKGYKMHDLF